MIVDPRIDEVLTRFGASPEEIQKGFDLYWKGEFSPIRERDKEDPEIVKQIDEQDHTNISGILLELIKNLEPGSVTRIYAIQRFIFLALGGKGKQKWAN